MRDATLRDVAARARVSIRTVSNVVNGYAPVSEALRARVELALSELDYRPNLIARNLKLGRSGMLCLVVPELDVPYFAELARAAITAGRQHGYTVMLDQTDADPEREREMLTRSSRLALFDGLILSPLTLSAQDLRARSNRAPVVLLGEHLFDGSFSQVAIDNVAASREATEHLIGLGRRNICAVGGREAPGLGTAEARTRGYLAALTEAGLAHHPDAVLPVDDFRMPDGARAVTGALRAGARPDALLCLNDQLALGALRALHEHGLRVPEDVAVIGFDDVEGGRFSVPTLSTVAPDKAAVARVAVHLLHHRIEEAAQTPQASGAGAAVREVQSPQDRVVAHRLVLRESTEGVA